VLSKEDALLAAGHLSELTQLNFFPADEDGRTAVFLLVNQLVSSVDQVEWLVRRLLALFDKWPGPATVRAVFCTRYRPADGVEGSKWLPAFRGPVPLEAAAAPAPVLVLGPPPSKVLKGAELEAAWYEAISSVQWPESVNKPKPRTVAAPLSSSLRAVLEIQIGDEVRRLRKVRGTAHEFVGSAGSDLCKECWLPAPHVVHTPRA